MGSTLQWLRRQLAGMSPEARQYLLGAGQAMDLFPMRRYETFYRDDAQALRSDWEKVGGDMWGAIAKAEEHTRRA